MAFTNAFKRTDKNAYSKNLNRMGKWRNDFEFSYLFYRVKQLKIGFKKIP